MSQLPALSLVAVPGRRQRTVELAAEIERRGFPGIHCPSLGDAMGLCQAIAHVTDTVEIATAIQPIYFRQPVDLAAHAGTIQELSGGRFRLGLGVSHAPVVDRLDIDTGKPLSDMRDYVDQVKGAGRAAGELPPITLATLRDKMVELSVDIADGAVWANGSRRHMAHSLSLIPEEMRSDGFFVGDMIPTVVDDDLDAARAVNRRTLTGYVALPNYRNYWKSAGYEEEMTAIEDALGRGDSDAVAGLMTDEWLDDCTLSGPARRVREGVEAWFDAGVTTPIVVPSSTRGGQFQAFEDVFAVWA